MTTRQPVVRVDGQSRQLPAGDDIGLPRYYRMPAAPTDSRLDGDEWTDTSSGITYTWFAQDGGQWVEWSAAAYAVGGYSTAGDIEITDSSKGLILRSPGGTRYRVTVDNSGTLTRTSV